MNYSVFYEKLTGSIRKNPKAVSFLKGCDRLLTYGFYGIYPILIGYVFLSGFEKPFRFVVIPGISFVMVSLFRHFYNRPRPYEKEGITPLWHKDTQGHSFPSRHVFSASMIAMSILYINPYAGAVLLFLSSLEGFIRVTAGIHYISDVTAGLFVGVLCGFLYWLV